VQCGNYALVLKVMEWFNDLINTIGLNIHFSNKLKLMISVK